MSILKQAMNNLTLATILATAALLLLSGCQDSGAEGFVEYSETDAVPAVVPPERASVDVDKIPEASQESPHASASRASTSDSDDGAAEESDTSSESNGQQATASAPPPVGDTAAGSEKPAADSRQTTPSGDSPLSGDSARGDVTGVIAASPVSDRSDRIESDRNEAMAELARQRAATLAAYGGAPFDAEIDGATAESDTASSEPREVKLLIPEKRLRAEGDAGALRVSYDDIDLLQILNMEPVPVDAVDHFPEWLSKLDGQQIRIRGFMYPTFQATGLTAFTLARDNGICCFVRQPKIYDIIGVRLAEGQETDYIEGKPFDVEGTFHIVPEADETELYQLYRIENAKVLH